MAFSPHLFTIFFGKFNDKLSKMRTALLLSEDVKEKCFKNLNNKVNRRIEKWYKQQQQKARWQNQKHPTNEDEGNAVRKSERQSARKRKKII